MNAPQRLWGLGLFVASTVLAACGDDSGAGASGGAGAGGDGAGATAAGGSAGAGASPAICDTDPLETGLVAVQTGISVDIADCSILHWASEYGEPDPMIVKAMIYVESRFDNAAAGCPNLPCGLPDGWAESEAGCYGMMQVVPSCSPLTDGTGMLPNGHPNLTADPTSPDWGNSIYNPDVNIHLGVAGFAGNRAEVKQLFPGCTEDQYTLMALGNLASHGSTTGCTSYLTDYIDLVLPAYAEYSAAAGWPAHPY